MHCDGDTLAAGEVCPTPFGHTEHGLLLGGASLYVPAGHAVHCAVTASGVYPAWHAQSLDALEPVLEVLSVGQAVHDPVPVVAL